MTYNRSRYLKKALDSIFAGATLSFPFEVLISDNASTDDTESVVREYAQRYPAIRYIRQLRNVGSEANMVAAYRQAIGEYTVYLADDDLLVPSRLAKVIGYMDRQPEVAVAYTPWELWDDVGKTAGAVFYKVDAPVSFSKQTAGDLCNYVIERHIFPEIFVYRSDALRRILYRQHKIYWAFANMINVLQYGDVAFLPTIFYRSVTQHWAGETRGQEGLTQVVSEWDLYRGGIEYMVQRAFQYAGAASIPSSQRAVVLQMVQSFVNERMKVALNLLIARRQFVDAFDVYARLVASGGLADDEATRYRSIVSIPAALQAFLETFRSVTRARCIGMYANDDPASVQTLLSELDPSVPLRALDDADLADLEGKEHFLVLCGNGDKRDILLRAGFPPGQVWAEDDLLKQFYV